MKRKVLTLLITILILTFMTIIANAANASVNDITAYCGDTVTFSATLSGSETVGMGGVSVSYDSNVLELVSGTCEVSGAMLTNFDVSTGMGAFMFSGTGSVSGTLFTATFKVKDTASPGTTTVSMDITLKDASNADISVSNSSGSITVKCNHSFTKEDTTYLKSEATCTSPAVYYKSCAVCGEKGTETFEHGTTAEHSYTKQVTTDAYKKSNASCTAKAVYYYCCATCDAKGTETYESGSTLAHNYTRKVVTDTYKKSAATCTDAAVYYYCCATCDSKGTTTYTNGSELGHTGGTATCTAKAVCTRCSQEYGKTLDHTYNQEVAQDPYLASAASCTAKAKYYKSCSCGAKGAVTFEVGEKKAHTYTEKVDALYLKSAATCTAKAVYYESCSVCGEKGTTTFETGDAPRHNYKTTWNSDSTSHWHECSKCGDKKDLTSHTAGAAATEYTEQTCTVCGYVITPALGHTHHYSTSWSKDANNHWYACSGCSTPKDKATHDYTNACDTDCNTCGYVREITHAYKTEWSKDAEKHWYECSVCGDKKNETIHTPGADATETTDQTCTVCGYVIREALGHTHNHNTMKNDETNHWNECACGDKTGITAHAWDDGVVTKEATYDEEGKKTFTCSTCSKTKIESVEKLVREDDINTDTEVGTDVPADTDKDTDKTEQPSGGCRSAIGIGAGSIVVIAIICGAVIFVKKRKST